MGDIPNLIDIEYYCESLSQITGLDIKTIRSIVLVNFSKIYISGNKLVDFTDATERIESEINCELLKKENSKKVIYL